MRSSVRAGRSAAPGSGGRCRACPGRAQVDELAAPLLGDQHPLEPGEAVGIHLTSCSVWRPSSRVTISAIDHRLRPSQGGNAIASGRDFEWRNDRADARQERGRHGGDHAALSARLRQRGLQRRHDVRAHTGSSLSLRRGGGPRQQAHRATMLETVPAMYMYMLAHPDFDRHDLSTLTRCTVGGQTMPVAKTQEVERRFSLFELLGVGRRVKVRHAGVEHRPLRLTP
jgi:hypothetical protein